MSQGIRHAAALGLVVALVSLATAPATAAPRAEEAPTAMLLDLKGLADQLVDLFQGWVRSVFAPSGGAGDPDGTPHKSDVSVPHSFALEPYGDGAGYPEA